MKTPTQTPEDFAIEMLKSYQPIIIPFLHPKECAIIECERLILYAEDTEYFKEVLKFLNNM